MFIFGEKPFIKHQAQGFEQFIINKAYDKEERSFIETVEVVDKK